VMVVVCSDLDEAVCVKVDLGQYGIRKTTTREPVLFTVGI